VALMPAKREMNKTRTGVNAIVACAATVLALLAVNLVGTRVFGRVDLTQDKQFTLSKASKDMVAKMPDRMTVKAFISKDLQPPFSTTATYVRDMLDEYAAASKGKLKWEAIDPGDDKTLQEEAQKLQVPKMRRGRVSQNKVEIGSSYLGVAFQYQGNVKSIPEINDTGGLEFQITSIVKEMTVKKRKIAFASSEGELSVQGDPSGRGGPGGLQSVNHYLADLDVSTVPLTKAIPDDVDGLVIAGPKTAFSERAKFVIDQFLMRGKSVAFLVNGMVVESANQMHMQIPGMENQPQIGRKNEGVPDDLLEHYGFKIRDDLIMEPQQNVPGPVMIGGQWQAENYEAFAATTKLAKDEPLLAGVRVAIFPFASSVELLKDKQAGFKVTTLASSTPDAWRETGFFLFDPLTHPKAKEDHGPFVFAAYGQGKLKSFFAGKPFPNEKGEKQPPPDANSSQAPGAEVPLNESTGVARIIVVGDANFASDFYLQMARFVQLYAANLQLAVNVIDWLTQDDTLAAVRAKTVQSRPLTVKTWTPALVTWANLIGVPFVFIVYGLLRWSLRTARRRSAKI
jgi:gliding motility-associatede transport system auxiliary component